MGKYFGSGKFIKCQNCEFNKEMSIAGITPGGNKEYLVTCKKEEYNTFITEWDGDIPCEEVTI
ncbi:MAG: hypothetical protein ABF289_18105 [Clostridiales bacterium]